MAMSEPTTSSVSLVRAGSDQSKRPAECSARSISRQSGPRAGSAPSPAAIASATALATLCVRDWGLGLPVTTAIFVMTRYLRLDRSDYYNYFDGFNIHEPSGVSSRS
jgi:hypothetical protein